MTITSVASRLGLERRVKYRVANVALSDPTIHWKYEVHSTPYFPFRAYASAVRGVGPNADEALVVALECYRPGGEDGSLFELQADISRQDGTILSESPKYEISLAAPADQTSKGIGPTPAERDSSGIASRRKSATIRSLYQWLEHQTPLIGKMLSNPNEEELSEPSGEVAP